MITELFNIDDAFNASTAKTNHQVLSYLLQDSSQTLNFTALLGYREQNREHGHEDTVLSQAPQHIMQQLMRFLHQHKIALNPALIRDGDWDMDEINRLLVLFKSVLLRNAYQSSECPHCNTTVLAAKQQAIDEALHRYTMKQVMPVAQASPDGNCFFNATALSIIHGILSGDIQEGTETGDAIKQRFLQPVFESIPALAFNPEHTLVAQVRQLLAYFTPSHPAEETPLVTVIAHCDWQRLQFVCAQPLRAVMNAALQNHRVASALASELCLNELVAYICVTHAERLRLDSETVALMKFKLAGGEYGRIEAVPAWFERIATQVKAPSSVETIRQAVKPAFNRWWMRQGFSDYCARHQENGMYAGLPQAMALASALKLNIKQVDRGTGAIVDYVTASPRASTIFIEQRLEHFNARLGRPEATSVTPVAAHLSQAINEIKEHASPAMAMRPAAPAHKKKKTPEQVQENIEETQQRLAVISDKQLRVRPESLPVMSAARAGYASFFASTRRQRTSICSGEFTPACIKRPTEENRQQYVAQLERDANFAAELQDAEVRNYLRCIMRS